MAEIPHEARKFKGETRERVRRALLTHLERDELRASAKLVTVASLVDAGSKDRNATTTCLRLWRKGELSVGESWDDAPAPAAGSSGEAPANDDLAELVRAARTD